ncbi:uncharacterized protein [Apostichopus japonicus]|uniref:uncharacterized protein isoform X2 n=1 Tax=Stichopus japonicus TaxID=307972 RepID=UPI003AB8791D
METKTFLHLFIVFAVCVDASLAAGKLCQFAAKFPGVGSGCYSSKKNAVSETSEEDTKETIESTTEKSGSTTETSGSTTETSGSTTETSGSTTETSESTTETSESTTVDITSDLSTLISIEGDCSLPDEAGSVLNCTSMYNCTDGLKSVNEEHYCCSNASCETRGDIHKCYRGSGFQGNGETCTHMTNCQDYFKLSFNISGIYTIKPTVGNGSSFAVFCNMADGGGWTVFQRRVNGSVDFYRNWTSYKEGFGELTHEFWLGNDKLYYLTNQSQYQLRVDLVDEDGKHYYALYGWFHINDESDHYRLSVGGSYNGTTGSHDNQNLNHLTLTRVFRKPKRAASSQRSLKYLHLGAIKIYNIS